MKAKPPSIPFLVAREYHQSHGIWNPRDKEGTFKGGLQIMVIGSRKEYLKLAEFFKRFAKIDTGADGDYHEHFEGTMSADGKTRLHIILRKDDIGNGIYSWWRTKRRTKASSKITGARDRQG